MFCFVLILFALVFNLSDVCSASDNQKCSINKPDISNCVFEALNSLKPQTGRENKQIKSFSSEPFVIPIFHITQESAAVNYTATATNFTIRGLDHFDLKYVRFDPKTLTFHGLLGYSPLSINTGYELEGHWVSIPVKGKGVVHAALGPINATIEVIGKMVNNKGEDHYNPTGLKIRMAIDDVGIYFDGLFGQNAELARVTNAALNANSQLLVNALTPAIEMVGESVFLKSIKNISRKVLHEK